MNCPEANSSSSIGLNIHTHTQYRKTDTECKIQSGRDLKGSNARNEEKGIEGNNIIESQYTDY